MFVRNTKPNTITGFMYLGERVDVPANGTSVSVSLAAAEACKATFPWLLVVDEAAPVEAIEQLVKKQVIVEKMAKARAARKKPLVKKAGRPKGSKNIKK